MTIDSKFLNYNDAGEQRSFDLIPAGSIVPVQLTVRPGGGGDDGWLRPSKDGSSQGLDCEYTVLDGEHAKRKIWALYTVKGRRPAMPRPARSPAEPFAPCLRRRAAFGPTTSRKPHRRRARWPGGPISTGCVSWSASACGALKATSQPRTRSPK
jgi:hypothetical protein